MTFSDQIDQILETLPELAERMMRATTATNSDDVIAQAKRLGDGVDMAVMVVTDHAMAIGLPDDGPEPGDAEAIREYVEAHRYRCTVCRPGVPAASSPG